MMLQPSSLNEPYKPYILSRSGRSEISESRLSELIEKIELFYDARPFEKKKADVVESESLAN